MNRMRRWMAHLTLLNILLAAILFGAAFYAAWPFFTLGVQAAPSPAAEPAPPAAEPAAAAGRSPMDFAAVTEQNLFHPERKMPPEKAKELPRPDLVLYGTLITGEASIAYVEDRKAPYSTPGRGKRQVALKKGDNVSGYILQEVEPNRIVLARGDDRLVVRLDGREKRPAAAAAPPAGARRDGPAPPPTVMPAPGQPAAAATQAAPSQPGTAALTPQPPGAGEQKTPVVPPRRQHRNPLIIRR